MLNKRHIFGIRPPLYQNLVAEPLCSILPKPLATSRQVSAESSMTSLFE